MSNTDENTSSLLLSRTELLEAENASLKKENSLLKEQVKEAEESKNDAYRCRAMLVQLLIAVGSEHGFECGIRTVGKQDPDWVVFAIKLDSSSEDHGDEIAFHVRKEDVVYPDAPSYEVPWEFEELFERSNLSEKEKDSFYKKDGENRENRMLRYINTRRTHSSC